MQGKNKTRLALASIVLGAAVACVLWTETLGTPSIPIGMGTGFVAAGTGLNTDGPPFAGQPGTIEFTVPDDATVVQVLLYWSGQMLDGVAGVNDDDTLVVNGTEITGSLIGGPAYFFSFGGEINVDAFRADITNAVDIGGAPLVVPGPNVLDVSGLDYYAGPNLENGNQGAGVIVIYDDGSEKSEIELRDGVDLAFCGFPEPRKTTVPQSFDFAPSDEDRSAELSLFVGSVGQELPTPPNALRISFDVGAPIVTDNPFNSVDGNFWDALTLAVPIPAFATQLTVEPISGTVDSCPGGSASITWIAAAVSVPPPPDALACTPGFWKNRADGKKGLLKFFPGDDWDDLVDAAVELSDGFFDDADELLEAVGTEGGAEDQAWRALAALLLNLAAGDLFPDGEKCALFETDAIFENSCGEDLSIGEALDQIFEDIDDGYFTDANECGDDINNGRGLM